MLGLDFSPNGQCIVISCRQTVVIRRLRDGFSRVLRQFRFDYSSSVRFSQDGRYLASDGDSKNGRIQILSVRTGRCLAMDGGDVDGVRDLVFTPDGKGLLTGYNGSKLGVSWLKSIPEDQRVLTGDLREIFRFVGHTVCQLLDLSASFSHPLVGMFVRRFYISRW